MIKPKSRPFITFAILCIALCMCAHGNPVPVKTSQNGINFEVKLTHDDLKDGSTAMEASWQIAEWFVNNYPINYLDAPTNFYNDVYAPIKNIIGWRVCNAGQIFALVAGPEVAEAACAPVALEMLPGMTMDLIDITGAYDSVPPNIAEANRELAETMGPTCLTDPLCVTSKIKLAIQYEFFYIFHQRLIAEIEKGNYPLENEYLLIRASSSPFLLSFDLIKPTQPFADKFQVTARSYSETVNLDQAVKNELGNDYRVADWNDVKAYSSDIQNWADSIGMNHNDYYFITWNGQGFSGNRHYFTTRFDGTVDPGYLVHDQIGGNIITLGSWYGIAERILAIRFVQPISQPIASTQPTVTNDDPVTLCQLAGGFHDGKQCILSNGVMIPDALVLNGNFKYTDCCGASCSPGSICRSGGNGNVISV